MAVVVAPGGNVEEENVVASIMALVGKDVVEAVVVEVMSVDNIVEENVAVLVAFDGVLIPNE